MSEKTLGEKVVYFIETCCIVPDGKFVGQPIKLLPFQKKFILAIYDGNRSVRRGYLSIARKNGKTALIACLVIAHLVGPPAILNSQIISGARSRDQAALVFKLAKKIVELSPRLAGRIKIVASHKQMFGLALNTEYQAISAESTTAHGLSPILSILDEVGQVRGPQDDFIDAITTAQGAHDAPLLIAISTQAPSDADLFSIWLDDAERSGDESIVSHVYQADKDCELDDYEQWKKANPALGIFRSLEDVQNQAEQAKRMPTAENAFRVLTLNQRVNLLSSFVSPNTWKIGNEYPGPLVGPVYAGLDLSSNVDLTALVLTARYDGKVHVHPYFWMPEDTVVEAAKRDRAPYDVWVKQGFINTTPGKVVDYAYVANDIVNIVSDIDLARLAFDRWRIDRLKKEFDALGVELPLEPFGQGYASMSPALDALEKDLLNGAILHGGNPVLTMCASNSIVTKDPAGNRKLDKSRSTGRIDGMVALAMAAGAEVMKTADVSPIPTYEMLII